MSPARRDITFAVLGMALVLLIIGQSYLTRSQPLPQGRIVFVLGLALAWWALPSTSTRNAPVIGASAFELRFWQRREPVIALALGLNSLATVYVWRDRMQGDALALWFAAVAMCLGSFVFRRVTLPRQRLGTQSVLSRLNGTHVAQALCLAVIVGLALYLRLFDIAHIPPFINSDEADFGIDALAIANGTVRNIFTTGFGDMPRLTGLPSALLLMVWNNRLEAVRAASALTAVATLPLLYLLARMLVSVPFALLATFFLAVSRIDIFMGRYGFNSAQSAVFTVAAIYFALRCMQRRSMGDAVVCGAVLGLSVYSYFSNRAIPIVVAGVVLYMCLMNRRAWQTYSGLGLVILAAALFVAAPQLGYYMANPDRLLGYTRIHLWLTNPSVLGDPQASVPTLLARQVDRALWGFTYYPDVSEHYHAVMLDSVTGILFFLGLIVCLKRYRQVGAFALLLAYIVYNLAFHVLIQGTPNAPRMAGLIPLLCLMAAIALEQIWIVVSPESRRAAIPAVMTIFVATPALILALNYTSFFQDWAPSRAYEPRTEVLRYIQSHDVTPLAVGGDFAPNDALFRFFAPGKTGYMMTTWQDHLPIRQTITRTAAFIAMAPSAPAMSIVHAYYPNGTTQEFRNPKGELLFTAYTIAAEDIAAYQGLNARYRANRSGSSVVERRDATIDFDWSQQRPTGIDGDFTVQWSGGIYAPLYGNYRLRIEGNGTGELWLDDAPLIRKDGASAAADGVARLAIGWHTLRLDYSTGGGSLRLLWTRPDGQSGVIGREYFSTMTAVHGLRAAYYTGTAATGSPDIEAIEPALYNRFTAFTVRHGQSSYAASWMATLAIDTAGTYRFGLRAVDDSCELQIDEKPVVSVSAGDSTLREGRIVLSSGRHNLSLDCRSPKGQTEALQLMWAPPGATVLEPLPPTVLTPAVR